MGKVVGWTVRYRGRLLVTVLAAVMMLGGCTVVEQPELTLPQASSSTDGSPDPSTLPFADAVRGMTGLRSGDRDVTEVTDARAVELFKACLLNAEEVPGPEENTRASRVISLRVGSKWETQSHQVDNDAGSFRGRPAPTGLNDPYP